MAQIILFNVTNDSQYHPQRRDYFNDQRWQEAKRTLAKVLQQHGGSVTKNRTAGWLMDRMVAGDFPAAGQGYHNGITCIANGGEHPDQRGEFTLYDEPGNTYIYEATTGDLCLAHFPEDGATQYYRIHVCEY